MAPNFPENLESEPKTSQVSSWFLIAAIFLAVLLLYFSLKGLDWIEFGHVIANGQYGYLIVVALISSVNYFLRSQRWRILLQSNQVIHAIPVFWATMIGYLGNAYLPARAGEVLRSVALGKKTGISSSFIFATALVERIIDVVALIVIGAFSLWLVQELPAGFQSGILWVVLLACAGLIFLLIVPNLQAQIQTIIRSIVRKESWNVKIMGLLERFIQGFTVLREFRRIAVFILMTALIWLVDGCGAMIIALIVQQTLSLPQALFLLAGLGLSSALPSTPGYVGVYQFVAISVLVPYGFSQSSAFAYILVLQMINYLVVSFWGLLGLWRIKI